MQTKSKTKDIAPQGAPQRYHFSGGGEYEPLSVEAGTQEEAEEIWQRERKKVETTTETLLINE